MLKTMSSLSKQFIYCLSANVTKYINKCNWDHCIFSPLFTPTHNVFFLLHVPKGKWELPVENNGEIQGFDKAVDGQQCANPHHPKTEGASKLKSFLFLILLLFVVFFVCFLSYHGKWL